MKTKKEFFEPSFEVIFLGNDDVILTSGFEGSGDYDYLDASWE